MNVAAQYSEKIISHIKNSVQKSLAFFQLVSPYWFLFMLEQIVYIFGAILKKKKGKISGLWLGNCNHDSFLFSAILLQISLCITAEHLHFGLIFLNALKDGNHKTFLRSLVVCSVTTFQTQAALPCSF